MKLQNLLIVLVFAVCVDALIMKGSDSNITLGADDHSRASQDKCKDPSIPKEDMSVCKPKKKGTKLNPKK